ncbi:MAG TPA: helix-turn-helix domain-containing protein [Gemmatimonadaceae bacterium]|nr:helix-turn-helix domain-containing protein [Gemmatimonadaceae bacterium]
MESKDRILAAAARVYAEHGFRGSTTRRIANAAGVNEVTLFRHFKSKEALLAQALDPHYGGDGAVLPDDPVDPPHEIHAWVVAHHRMLCDRRAMMRKALGELEERPGFCAGPRQGAVIAAAALEKYIARLAEDGWIDGNDRDLAAAPMMLLGTLFGDAMGRDFMSELYRPVASARESYARLFLRAIGYQERRHKTGSGRVAAPAGRGNSRTSSSR